MSRKSALGAMVVTLVVSAVCLGAVVSLTIIAATDKGLTNRLDDTLSADVTGFTDLYEQRRLIGVREGMERRQEIVSPNVQIFLLLNRDGSKLGGNIDKWPDGLAVQTDWQTFVFPNSAGREAHYRGGTNMLRGGFKFLNARNLEPNRALIASLKKAAFLATISIGFLSALLGWLFARRILSQIDAVNIVASRVEDGFLDDRVALSSSPNEFQILGKNINAMLDKIGSHQKRMNAMSEHIAHELKTPLNRIKKSVHAIRKYDANVGPEIQDSIERIDDEVSKTIRAFDSVLEIVTTHHSISDKTSFQPVDTSIVIDELLTLYEPLADEKNIAIHNNCTSGLSVFGDKTLLMQMFSNVIDNAVKFTDIDGVFTIRSLRRDGHVIINFTNDGNGIAGSEKDKIFSQFQRAGNVGKTPGYGLGLALVKAIATRHGFDVHLPESVSGFEIEFRCIEHIQPKQA
ncbi:MAG: ATP-binding protein [Hyphomicrobiales bacterium]